MILEIFVMVVTQIEVMVMVLFVKMKKVVVVVNEVVEIVAVKDYCSRFLVLVYCSIYLIYFWELCGDPGGLGAFLTKSLATCFLPMSSSFRKKSTIGFSASNDQMSSKTSSSAFYLLMMFLLIESSFCLKLALLILSFGTQLLMIVCILFAKSLVARYIFVHNHFHPLIKIRI